MHLLQIFGAALFAWALLIMARPLWSHSGKWWDTSRAGRLYSVFLGAGFAIFSLRLILSMSTFVGLLSLVVAGALMITAFIFRSSAAGAA